jgi:hypothetical protein
MNTKRIIEIIIIVVVVALGAWYVSHRDSASEPAVNGSSVSSSANGSEQKAVESAVIEFGKHLKNVSLLAIGSDAAAEMQREYAPYVAPELLALWKADRNKALGRETSNPYPDSLYVASATRAKDGSYTVEANVVEVTTANPGEAAGIYPVTLKMEKRGGSWLIVSATKGPRGTIPQRVTMTGVYTCLLHRNTSGPQTLECAEGFKEDGGKTYALDGSLAASTQTMGLIRSGVQVRVQGVLTPAEMLSTDRWQNYQMSGILSVTSAERI